MQTTTKIAPGFEDISPSMKKDCAEIYSRVKNIAKIESYPNVMQKKELSGTALARAYPIQGIIKYHGMSDWDYRTAFMSSISLNTDAAQTITYVKFNSAYKKDMGFINDVSAQGRDLERISQVLNMVRSLTDAKTKALVVSRNIVRATKTGKGLGTSASGSAALATAAIAAALGEEYTTNTRFLSCIGRFLAGSGCRSITGGISLWLSYPGIPHETSFALRLDTKNQFKDVCLITIPLDSHSGLKTELAHQEAPHSPFFRSWLQVNKKHIIEAISAVEAGDWQKLGELAELDTILLHGVTMSGSRKNKIIAWEPATITLMRACNELRDAGIPVYFSIDTGPTPVFITHKKYERAVAKKVKSLGFEFITGSIAGPSELLPETQAEELLHISKYA